MRIVLLGAPGSGKGTQAKMMAEKYRVPQISTGDILRMAVADKTEIGKKVAAIMEAGELVSDEIVIDAVTDRLRSPGSRRGFVLDGFPRNIPQAQELDTRLGWLGRPLQLVLHLALDRELVVRRITGRLTCSNCGAIYNKYFSPPTKRGTCDKCGANDFAQRADDTEKAVRTRLEAYEQDTAPLITYYKAQHKLRTIEAMADVTGIFAMICEVVDIEIRPLEKKVVVADTLSNKAPAAATVISGGKIERAAIDRKAAQKKTPPTKTAKKAPARKKVSNKKTPSKKAAQKKTLPKKTAKKAPTRKKVSNKKTPSKKAAQKKTPATKTAKKAPTRKKVSNKKVPAKKSAGQAVRRKKPSRRH